MELANGKTNKFFTLKSEGENRYFIDNFDYKENAGMNNIELLMNEVKENSIVLDIGCGQGKFGKALREKNCMVYGIDLDKKAAEYAEISGYYEKVFTMDINNRESEEYILFKDTINEVDVIILSDVFEHMVNPTELLVEYSKFLKTNGLVLVSVPNVAHIDILLNLLNDKFNYQDMGILDNTHLKFFSKTSFVDWINQINETFDNVNYDCEYLGATFYNNEFLNTVKEKYYELFNILENCVNYNGFQILFKLIKLPTDLEPLKLKNLKDESKVDVIDILGNALRGKVGDIYNHKVVEGERLWYEQQFKWHNENNGKINRLLEEKDEYIKKIEDGIKWHIEEQKNIEQLLEDKDIEFENKIVKYNEELSKLRKMIFDMENSRSWRWTKFLR